MGTRTGLLDVHVRYVFLYRNSLGTHQMTDNGTLRDHLEDVTSERNELLRLVEEINTRIAELTRQLAAMWKVS